MESMEQQMTQREEIKPRSFVEQIRERAVRVLEEIRKNLSDLKEGVLEMPESMTTIREGNFSDELRTELHVKARRAEELFKELPKGVELSKEEFHNRQGLAKLVEFYELQEDFFARLAEVKDDPDLNEIALIMWSELQETYAKCAKEFSGDALLEE